MESRYAEKEKRVLQKLYELSGPDHTNIVDGVDLVQALGMSIEEASLILRDLSKRKGLVTWDVGDNIQMTGAGIEVIESAGQRLVSVDTYHMHVGTVHGGIQQGPGNIQNINITNDVEFDKAIANLLQLVQSSSLATEERQELTDDIVKVNGLALREPTPSLLDKVNGRLEIVKVGLTSADLLVKAGPYLDAIWHYFKSRYNL